MQIKKEIIVPYLLPTGLNSPEVIATELNRLEADNLDQVCWVKPPHVPVVSFVIAYNENALFVKFYVHETCHRAVCTNPNDPVFKDSCVEMFIAVDNSGSYYNFEFNSLGTCLSSYGKDRYNRKMLDKQIIRTIACRVEWKEISPANKIYNWELTFILKPSVLCYNQITSFTPGNFTANFYKCGDALEEPHYLAWNPVLSAVPDFHQPAFFGVLKLVT